MNAASFVAPVPVIGDAAVDYAIAGHHFEVA
jgi:hypothetical protein